jgi:hypothetical protein
VQQESRNCPRLSGNTDKICPKLRNGAGRLWSLPLGALCSRRTEGSKAPGRVERYRGSAHDCATTSHQRRRTPSSRARRDQRDCGLDAARAPAAAAGHPRPVPPSVRSWARKHETAG